MIVAVDGTPALRPYLTGTEVYARSIIEALAESRGERRLRVYANALDAPSWLPGGVDWRGIPFPRLWSHWRLRQALRREAPDVAFIPSHVLPVGLGRMSSVVTVHDVGHRHQPQAYARPAWLYLELTTRYAARHATRLIAVSQSTANDLKRFYAVPGGRIAVIHSGVDQRMHPQDPLLVAQVTQRLGLEEPYFLYVGRNHPRKNLPMLRRAFRQARRGGLPATLVLAGGGHDQGEPTEGVIVLPYVAAEDLPALYAGAIALLLPSRFEGFGFPVVEAMRCRTAVIASTAGALPEIVGTAGVLLSPDDPGAWSHAMIELARDPDLQRRLIAAGSTRGAMFSWEVAAERTWRVLESAARRSHPQPENQSGRGKSGKAESP